MFNWRSIADAARRAGALLIRDRSAGEAEFVRLLARHPNDGMVLLERGRSRVAAGDPTAARADLEAAIRQLPLEQYKEEAARDLARLPAAPAASAIEIPPARRTMHVPSTADLLRAHAIFLKNEPRSVDFDVAVRLLEQALSGTHRLSATVPTAMLLQSWNFPYYQKGHGFDRNHFDCLDAVIESHRHELLRFRKRELASMTMADEQQTATLFRAFAEVVGRVGAAKLLHLWAPLFFPLWDTWIANAYGFDLSEPVGQYWEYMAVTRTQVNQLVPPPSLAPLKALDEYNYCVFTKQWLPA
jgi:hypothetical protein